MAELRDYKLMLGFPRQKDWAEAPMWLEMSFGGLGGGMFLIGAASGNMLGCLIGYLLMMGGKGLFLLADLGKPMRFMKVFKRPLGSWISFGAWVMMLFGAAGGLYVLPYFIDLGLAPGLVTALKVIAMLAAAILITYDGFFLAASAAISAWTTGLLAPLFALSALAAGSGLIMLLGDASPWLPWANLAILIALALVITAHLTAMHKGAVGARKSKEILLRGAMRAPFVYGAVIAGLAFPLCILLLPAFGPALPYALLSAACLAEVFGLVCLRYSLLKSGVKTPVILPTLA